MKVTFKPLHDPKPVTPADMPEGVAFEYDFGGSIKVGIMHDGFLCGVSPDGAPWSRQWDRNYTPEDLRVLSRRDGKPLPNAEGEPVPLDTLEPFPVWYKSEGGWAHAHDGHGGRIEFNSSTKTLTDLSYEDAGDCNVYPTPHIMVVTPD